jgi:predicted RNase H-like HicB family nuclease
MKFPGKIYPKKNNEKYHDVEIPLLGIHTQGKNYKDSINMAKDALEELLNIEIIIEKYGMDGEFIVTSNELKPLIARFLESKLEHKI